MAGDFTTHGVMDHEPTRADFDVLERANDVLDRAIKLDDAVANLRAFRSMLEDLNSRTPINLAPPHVQALEVVRAGILRSTIGLAVAILDPPDHRGNRASLGQINELLKDQTLADFLTAPNAKRSAKPHRQKLSAACTHYDKLYAGEVFKRVRLLRHSIAHLLVQDGPSLPRVDYSDIFALADEIEECFTTLYQGLGIKGPHFIDLKERSAERAKLFWETYLQGASKKSGVLA